MIDKNKRYKILMAEQDPFLIEMYQRKFEQCGFNFIHVPDIKEGFVELVAKEKPHIISLGVIFFTIDGFTAIRMLKKDKRTKNIPVIFLTNLGEKIDIETGLSLGAVEYLVMAHTTPADLVNKVIKHLNQTYNANIASIEIVEEKIQANFEKRTEKSLLNKKKKTWYIKNNIMRNIFLIFLILTVLGLIDIATTSISPITDIGFVGLGLYKISGNSGLIIAIFLRLLFLPCLGLTIYFWHKIKGHSLKSFRLFRSKEGSDKEFSQSFNIKDKNNVSIHDNNNVDKIKKANKEIINKNNTAKFLAAIFFIVLFVAFYWYEWRPTQAKKYCNGWAIEKAARGTKNYDQDWYDDYYKRCLREKGL